MAKKNQKPQNEVLQLVDMIKNAAAGRKTSVDREDIKRYFDFLLLEQVYKTFEKKNCENDFLKVLGITAKRWGKIFGLLKHYKLLVGASSEPDKSYVTNFHLFTNILGSIVDFKVHLDKTDHSHAYIEFLNPPLECMRGRILFFRSRGDLPEQEIQRFVNTIESKSQDHLRKIAYILTFQNVEDYMRLTKESRYKFVVLSSIEMKDIVLASSPQIEFNVVTTRQLDLLDIQPYRTHGSTPSMMFFGRKREIDWMLNDPRISFAIYGGRQLGKTSLLRKIQEILDEEVQQQKTVFITCEGIQNNLALGLEILKQCDVDISGVKTIPDFENTFRDYLRTQKSKHTIFIDEVDDIVDLDRSCSHKVFVSLRNIHNDFREKCRFFFAGFKKLYSEFYRLYAPFRNFAEPYELKSLGQKESRQLILEPLCNRLGIRFLHEQGILKMYEYTAGHPCFIQHYCKCLIERIAEDSRRVITEEDVEEVYRSEAYRNLIIGTYSDNFKEGEKGGDVIPKLIICHIIFEELDTFDEKDLLESLHRVGVEMESFRLRSELRKLTMTSVLERHRNFYRFTNSVYPRILRESENLTETLIQLIEKSHMALLKPKAQTTSKISSKEARESQKNTKNFFHRSSLEQIAKDSSCSYAVIGGQGFGKSALLKNLESLYVYDLSYKPTAVSAKNCDSPRDLICQFVEKLGMRRSNNKENIAVLREFIADENQHGGRVVLLIDDLDHLIRRKRRDTKKLLKEFENLSLEFDEGFRVIISGGVDLYEILSSSKLLGGIEIIHIKPLDERDARQHISNIIKEHESLSLEDETLVDIILEYTDGSPSLAIEFCHYLFQTTEEIIREEDIERTGTSDGFRHFLLRTYENSWDGEQKEIVQLIMEIHRSRFRAESLSKKVSMKEEELEISLHTLELLGFLKRVGKAYRLSNPYYKECYLWRCESTN